MDSHFANEIARACLNHYKSLPKKGKPIPNAEWTLLSCIVMTMNGEFTVVAMATGTKCIGRNKMSPRGDVVNDSHAEVLARRCFIRYMYDQITTFKQTGLSDIIVGCNDRNQFKVNSKVKFHFYSSHVPCGDASIILKLRNEQEKRKPEGENIKIKRTKLDSTFHLGDCSKSSSKKDLKNTLKNNDEDLRDNSQRRPNEDSSVSSKACCADEDLRTVPLDKQMTDEDLRFATSDFKNCRHITPQNPQIDEDLRIPKIQEDLKYQNCYDEDLRFLNRVEEKLKVPVKHTEDKDDRNLSKYFHEYTNKWDEDLRIINSKPLSKIGDEDLRCCDEDMRNFLLNKKGSESEKFSYEDITEEHFQDCVGEVVDIHRTGAKCVVGENRKDRKLPGVLYHTVGAVRTKPGRGDPTLSVSCSDKLARWIACGLQGALLSLLLAEPVLLNSVVIGSGGPFSLDVLHRAIISRTRTSYQPALLHSTSVFPCSRYTAPSAKPCPTAILWSRVSHKALEISVEGRRQGATKKCADSGRLMICKLEILKAFLSLALDKYQGMTYKDIKRSADQYNAVWTQTRCILGVWTTKPTHLEDFILN